VRAIARVSRPSCLRLRCYAIVDAMRVRKVMPLLYDARSALLPPGIPLFAALVTVPAASAMRAMPPENEADAHATRSTRRGARSSTPR